MDDYPHPRRNSLRLQTYDYSQPGAYFVTIVTHERRLLFEVPEYREIVEHIWAVLSDRIENLALDAYVVMPNHFHGILSDHG